MNRPPLVSVIIPSLDGNHEDLNRLKRTVLSSKLPPDRVEILAAVGISPNGRARDVAAARARGEILVFMDADVSFPDPVDVKRIVEYLREHPDVGLCGPAQQIPPGIDERDRQRALQMPRSHVNTVDRFTETDMVTHACLAIRRSLFERIGMEHPNLISGTDPDLRHRVRSQGLKVGIVPGTRVFHPPITGWRRLCTKSFNGGRRSRWVRRHYPAYHLSAQPNVTTEADATRTSVFQRLRRHLGALGYRMRRGQGWALTAQIAYLTGFVWESLFPRSWVRSIPYPEPPGPGTELWDRFLQALRTEGELRRLHPSESTGDSAPTDVPKNRLHRFQNPKETRT